MQYAQTIAKAITAFIVAGLAAVVTYNVDVNPWVLVAGAAIVPALAVWAVPNK